MKSAMAMVAVATFLSAGAAYSADDIASDFGFDEMWAALQTADCVGEQAKKANAHGHRTERHRLRQMARDRAVRKVEDKACTKCKDKHDPHLMGVEDKSCVTVPLSGSLVCTAKATYVCTPS